MNRQEYLTIVSKMFAAGVKDAGGSANPPYHSALGAYFYGYGNTAAGVSVSVSRALQVAAGGWDTGAAHANTSVPQDLVGDKYLSTLWVESTQEGETSGEVAPPPIKTSSNLWWTMNEVTPELAEMNRQWIVYSQKLLEFAVGEAKSAAITLSSFRNATNSPNANTGKLLSVGLDAQAATLFAMADEIARMFAGVITRMAFSPLLTTSLLIALAKYTVKERRYYVDKDRANTIRSKDETFYPFLIVNDSAYWPTTIQNAGDPTASLFSLVLMDAKGNLILVSQDSSYVEGYRFVGAVHPKAFVLSTVDAPPWGSDLPTSIPKDDKGVLVVTTEDAVHQVIGKLLDYAQATWSKMAVEMQEYYKKNPGAAIPTLPAPPPTVADVNVQLPPPTPGTGGTKIGLIDIPDPPSTPVTATSAGPSLWKVAGAILLAGGVGYAAWKVTGMMMDKEHTGRTAFNPSGGR